jgi:predicted DNA-binding protein
MKISDIQSASKPGLNSSLTFILSDKSKNALALIADNKGRTLSEVVREIVEGFLAHNSDELKRLG